MDIAAEVLAILGQPESDQLEYKAVLPPASTLAPLISSMANTDGGFIILGVSDKDGTVGIHGLKDEFRALPILAKAVEVLSPPPAVHSQYVSYGDVRVFAIKVEKSPSLVNFEGRDYIRIDGKASVRQEVPPLTARDARIGSLLSVLRSATSGCTSSKYRLIEHYVSLLSILDSLDRSVDSQRNPVRSDHARTLMRILFSSCADNVEVYLSDLLYEIYLAKPETLRSEATVSVREVLECSDLQEFIGNYARKKLSKLQRGSVRGFIAENKHITSLNVLGEAIQEEIERILQIRHLFSHRNGIVDVKFQGYFPSATLNTEYEMPLDEFLDRFNFLTEIASSIDSAAMQDYSLASVR